MEAEFVFMEKWWKTDNFQLVKIVNMKTLRMFF